MASEYGYATVEQIEARAGLDYGSLVDPYTDTEVESKISQGERLINIYCNTSFTTAPDGAVFVTIEIAYKLMYNDMLSKGMLNLNETDVRTPIKPLDIWDDWYENLLDPFRKSQGETKMMEIVDG
jgi:hypothetical protein